MIKAKWDPTLQEEKHVMKTKYLIFFALSLLIPAVPVGHPALAQPDDLPLPVQVVLTKAYPLMQKKEYGRAIEVLQKFQARGGPDTGGGKPDPKGYHHPEIYFALGNCHLLQEQYKPAETAFRQAVSRDETHTNAWLNLAKTCYEQGRYADAGRCFGRGYATAGEKKAEYLYFSAAAYLMANDHKRSITLFEQLQAAHPDDFKPEWKEHFVHALLAGGQARRALPYIRELANTYTGGKQIQWQEILLYQYMQLEMRKEALNLALSLTRQAPTIEKWWKALAHIHLQEDRLEEALGALTIYSFLTPLSPEEQKLLADLNLQLGIPVKAAPLYEARLAAETDTDKTLLTRLVQAYRQLGRPEAALKQLDAVELGTGYTDLMLLKGELLYTLKQYEKAADIFRQAAQNKDSHAGRAWLMAGYAAWQTHDVSASKTAFMQAAKHKKEKKAATAALKQLARGAGN